MRLDLLLLALVVVPFSPQDPKPEEPKPFALSDSAMASGYDKQIEGAWQVVRVESPQLPLFPGQTVGYALFLQGYCSLEIHGVTDLALEDSDGQFFQTGFHRYTLDGLGGMETSSLIGITNLNSDEFPAFQPPGDRRRFRISIIGEDLKLERSDGTRLTLKKLGKLPFPGIVEQLDAFGRPVKTPGTPPSDGGDGK